MALQETKFYIIRYDIKQTKKTNEQKLQKYKRKIVNLQSNIHFVFYIVYMFFVEMIYVWINVKIWSIHP